MDLSSTGHITDDDRIGYKIAEILNVPKGYELDCMFPIGVAEGEAIGEDVHEYSNLWDKEKRRHPQG